MRFRVALSLLAVFLLAVSLLAAPASAQFTTADLQGGWTVHALRVAPPTSVTPPSWIVGGLQFTAAGAVAAGDFTFLVDFYDEGVAVQPGALSVAPGGDVTGTLGNVSFTGRFVPGPGAALKTQIVGVARGDAGTPDEAAALVVLVKATPASVTQADATGGWRLRTLQVPGPGATVSEAVSGRLVVTSEGEIDGGELTSSNGSTTTFVEGNLFVLDESGRVEGSLVTSPFENEFSVFTGVFTADRNLVVGVAIRDVEGEVRLGMFLLQRETTAAFVTADLAGQWALFSVQSRANPGVDGFTLSGNLGVDASGTITSGALQTSTGLDVLVPDGFFLIDNLGVMTGSLFTSLGTMTVQATMLPDRTQVVGVDDFAAEPGRHLGLLSLVKAGPPVPASSVQFRAGNVTVTEGTAGTFLVDRTGATTTAVTVTYTATPLDAVPGVDFTPVSGTLSFPAGIVSRAFTVPTLANTRLDGNRTVMLSLGAPTNGARLGRDTSILTILDNDRAGTVRLGAATYTVAESAAALVVSIIRAGTSLAGNVSVSLVTGNGSAVSGLDFEAVDTTVTFGANETVKTLRVPVLDDRLAEGPQTFPVSLHDPTNGATLGTPATATATIVDNDVAGTLRFERAAYTVGENGGSVVLRVVRTGGAAGGVTVDFTTEDGAATAEGGDYSARSGTLSFGAGNTSATITLEIRQDAFAEGNEPFTVRLGNPQGGASLAAPSVATVTIVDDEIGLQLGATAYTAREGPTPVVVTIERTGPVLTPASVTFTATPGTATVDLDFTPVATVVSFPPNVRTRTVSVPLRNNTLVQGNRTVLLELRGPTGGALLGPRSLGVLTILEDDQPGLVRLSAPTYSVAERAGTLAVTILRTGVSLAGNVSVSYTTGNGSAVSGLDFGATAGTVVFNAKETSKIVRVPVLDDALVEGNQTFTVSLFGPTSGAVLGTPATATATIVDDDRGGVVRFSAAGYAFSEGAGNASITVVRSAGAAGDVLVDYTFQDLTAAAGEDYGAVDGTLSFAAGQTTAVIGVPIVQDLLGEGNQTFRITLGNVRGGATLAAPVTTTVTIVDDESAIQFQRPEFTGREGAPAVITVVRSGALTTPASVTFTASPGTAVPGLNFTPVSTLISFPANTPTRTVSVPLPNNPLVQGNRTVLLALGAPTGGAQLGPNAAAVLTALDDDQGGVIRLSTAAYVVNEAAGVLRVDILRAGTNLAGNVSVGYATIDGTALANVSYVAQIGRVTFNAGETRKSVAIPIVNDTLARGPLRFGFALGEPAGGAALGTPSSADIAIADNDLGGVVRLSGSAFKTLEGTGTFGVTLLRSGGAASEAAVDYTITHVSTDAGDVTATTIPGTVAFGAGQTSAVIPIPILQDDVREDDETFTISLANARGGAALAAPFTATVTVVDDEAFIEFNGLFQGNQPEVVRTGPLGGTASVQFTTASGTALLGQDFVLAETGTLVFPAGKAVVLLPLRIVADNLAEGPETFTVTLSSPSQPARLGARSTQMFTIQDSNFGGRVQFGAAQYAGAEGETVTLTVRRDGGTGTILPVSWALIGGNASASDFAPPEGVLTFAATETTKTLTLTLTADALVEGPETATLALGVLPGAAELGPDAVTTLRIADATAAPASVFQLASATATVGEGNTVAVLLTRTGDLSQEASVEYVTTPGTATLGDDYALVGGSVTFGPGSDSAEITADTVRDQAVEGPETFSITLQNPSANAAIGTPSTVVVTITDPQAQAYTFTVIAEATGEDGIDSFDGVPALNSRGDVTVVGVLADGRQSVLSSLAGSLTTVASTEDGTFTSFGAPSITDTGEVVFRAFRAAGGTGIYRAAADGSSLTPVAEPDGTYSGFGEASVSRNGRVAFRASLFGGEEEAVIAGTLGSGLVTVADDAGGRFGTFGPRAVAGDLDHHVAFAATEDGGAFGLYLSNVDGEAGVVSQIVDAANFDGLAQLLSINNQGQVAFLGFPAGGGAGIFIGRNGSAVTTVVTSDGPFAEFGQEGDDGTPSINDAGRVAFHAYLQDESSGIFTGPDPLLDKVIATGDPLLDSTVLSLALGQMNNAGQIVFRAFLGNERSVIVLATPAGGGPAAADVSVSAGASPANPGVATVATFTVTATNLGPATATGVQVSSPLPLGYLLQSAEPGQGAYNPLGGVWTVGTLPAGASATLTLRGLVLPIGPYTLTATRTASSPADPNPVNDTAAVGVTPAALVLSTEGPLVGVGRTISGQVSLGSPAPPGGVDVTLAAAPGGIVGVPATVSIPVGATSGNFSVTGVAIGSATLTASAGGFQDGTAGITVTGSVISLGALPTLGLGQALSLPISLSTGAPAGGVTVNFASNDSTRATVTPSVFIPAGAQVPAANPQVTGVNVGSAQITASATGFGPDSRTASVAVNVTFTPATFGVIVGTTRNITVSISAPAPAGGLTVDLTTGNGSVATVVSPVTVPAGQLSVPAAVTGVVLGSTTLQASGAGVTSAAAAINVTVPPALTLSAETVGLNLQAQGSLSLGAPAPAGGVQVTLTSADPGRFVIAGGQTAAGAGQLTVTINAGASSTSAFWVQALADSGTVTMTATAPGYTNGSALVTLTPAGFTIASPGSFSTTALAGNTSVQITSARLNPGTLTFAGNQPLRGGITPVNVVVTATDQTGGPGVGAMTVSPVTFTGGTVSAFTQFDPMATGTSLIEAVTPAGFNASATSRIITATVTTPGITVSSETVGLNLQTGGSLSLGAPAPAGGLQVTLTSDDPTRVVLSGSQTAAGSGSIVLNLPAGSVSTGAFFVQALADSGTVPLRATAPGYTNGSALVTLTPAGFTIASPGSFSTTALSGNTSVQITSARLNPGTLTFAGNQPLRGGITPVDVAVTATDQSGGPGVGAVTLSPVTFTGGTVSAFTQFDPAAAGTSLIEVLTPVGFNTSATARTITATVTAPALSLASETVGLNLQTQGSLGLGAPAPAGGLPVTLTSGDPSRVVLSAGPTVAGNSSIVLNVPAGSVSTGAFFVQALADSGTVTMTATAPGFTNASAVVTLTPAGFVVTSPGSFSTTTFSGNTSVQITAGRLAPGTLAFAGNQPVRGGIAPVDVVVSATDQTGGPGVGVITLSPVTFTGGSVSAFTAFNPAATGTSLIEIATPPGFNTSASARMITATVTAPAINLGFTQLNVGRDLQDAVTLTLGAAPPSPITVRVTVTSTAIATLSAGATVAGADVVEFTNVTSQFVGTLFVQGRALGSTTVTAQAPGYADAIGTVRTDPSGFILNSGNLTTTAGAANLSVQVTSARLDPTTLNVSSNQPVRGGATITVPVTVADQSGGPGVGALTNTPLTFTGGQVSQFAQYDPAAPGTSLLTVGTPLTFHTPSNNRQITITVNP